MTNLPPSRTADKILIRLPDGMRDRLHARAEANGRSMTAEVVSMLESGLNEGVPAKLDSLIGEHKHLRWQLDSLTDVLMGTKGRHDAVLRQIRMIAESDVNGSVPEAVRTKAKALVDLVDQLLGEGE